MHLNDMRSFTIMTLWLEIVLCHQGRSYRGHVLYMVAMATIFHTNQHWFLNYIQEKCIKLTVDCLPLWRRCWPNQGYWDISYFFWDIGIFPLWNWDIGICIRNSGYWSWRKWDIGITIFLCLMAHCCHNHFFSKHHECGNATIIVRTCCVNDQWRSITVNAGSNFIDHWYSMSCIVLSTIKALDLYVTWPYLGQLSVVCL